MAPRRVVVVGASLAGVRAAEALLDDGYDGELTVVGAEHRPPYDRPPLSKQVLAGAWAPEKAALKVSPEVTSRLRLGVAATGVDLERHTLSLADASVLGWDGLVLATGATARTLPGTAGMAGVHVLRTLDDCVALAGALDRRPRVAVIGAGFIGGEVAAACRSRGLDVTVIEALELPLVRILGPVIGALCAEVHRDNGTSLRLGVGVAEIEGGDTVERVRLADGSAVEADVVVVGIGVHPATGWLEGSGLTLDGGIVCDSWLRAADGVVAAGDVARWRHPRLDEDVRIEHWTNAAEQGRFAARTLLRGAEGDGFAAVPYFWSDLYDRKLQVVGLSRAEDDLTIVEGSLAERRFVAALSRAGRLVGAISCNMPHRIMTWRAQVDAGAAFPA